MGCADGAQVIRGLEPAHPGELVQIVEFLAVRLRHVKVQRLCLVDPFLPARRRLNQPARIDLEGGGVDLFEIFRHPLDPAHAAVVVLEVVDHHLVPEAESLEILHQVRIDYGELAGQIGFHVQVLIGRFNGLHHAADV